MAINKNFYAVVNSLVSQATEGTAQVITDYKTFVDFGKTLSSLNGTDFANSYMGALANRIRLTIDTSRTYQGKLKSLVRGSTTPEAVIEMIKHGFFDMRQAKFVDVPDGVNDSPFVTNKGKIETKYFINDVAFQLPVSQNVVTVISAFDSPEAMNSFLNNVIAYAVNSIELAKENSRRGMLAAELAELAGSSNAATTADGLGQRVKLLTIYNGLYGQSAGGTDLTADNCMYNTEFIKFAIRMIKKYQKKMTDVSSKLNSAAQAVGYTGPADTFTPEAAQRLITLSALDDAIVAYKTTFQGEATQLGDHESVSYWQYNTEPYKVISNAKNGKTHYVATKPTSGMTSGEYYYAIDTGKTWKATGATTSSEVTNFNPAGNEVAFTAPIIGILFDEFAIGQYETHNASYSIFNPVTETTTTWFNIASKQCILDNANAVVFTLE